MARPTAPVVEIELDKIRHLKYDFNALAAFEEKSGISLLNPVSAAGMDSIKHLRALIWAGLLHEDSTLTVEQVGAMLDLSAMDYINECVAKARYGSNPEPKPDATPDPNPPTA